MANNSTRIQARGRINGVQRPKTNNDENATSRHLRQASGLVAAGASRASIVLSSLKTGGAQRPALGEVTTTAVNRKDVSSKSGKEILKTGAESNLKRSRSSSLAVATGPQRVPLGPSRTETSNLSRPRVPLSRPQKSSIFKRVARQETAVSVIITTREVDDEKEDEMEIEEIRLQEQESDADLSLINEQEVEAMVEDHGLQEEQEETAKIEPTEKGPYLWPDVPTECAIRHHQEVMNIRQAFQDDIDYFDTTMVSEYADEIFEYMSQLEEDTMANPDYMSGQNEISWEMRQTLVNWLLQVHVRYHMLPETLWIAVNIVDRFLTRRVVSLMKLQLVGVTAMFIAAKYEEILAPGVEEFVYMTQNGYSREEILKGERIMLQTLEYKVSQYCSPYSWMRRISKADDYDIHTRTLSKFLTEVTLMDYRFLRCKPSLIAAVGMYSARRMLGGDWADAFVFHSGFVAEQLEPGHQWICDKLLEDNFTRQHVFEKYSHKKFLKASIFAYDWAKANAGIIDRMGYEDEDEE